MAISKKEMKEMLKAERLEVIKEFSQQMNEIKSSLEMAFENIKKNESEITSLKDEVITLKEQKQQQDKKLQSLELQLDDQINRSLRTTLIFRGVEMTQQEKNWNDTEENLKKEIKKSMPRHPNPRTYDTTSPQTKFNKYNNNHSFDIREYYILERRPTHLRRIQK